MIMLVYVLKPFLAFVNAFGSYMSYVCVSDRRPNISFSFVVVGVIVNGLVLLSVLQALTEPGYGSDASSLNTTAEKVIFQPSTLILWLVLNRSY